MASIARDIIDSIFAPTTKPQRGVVKAMNWSFYSLFITLFWLAFVTSWNPHVLALTCVAILLFASISWFIAELGQIQDAQEQEKAAKAQSDSSIQAHSTSTATAIRPQEGDGLIDRKAGISSK